MTSLNLQSLTWGHTLLFRVLRPPGHLGFQIHICEYNNYLGHIHILGGTLSGCVNSPKVFDFSIRESSLLSWDKSKTPYSSTGSSRLQGLHLKLLREKVIQNCFSCVKAIQTRLLGYGLDRRNTTWSLKAEVVAASTRT